METLARNWAIVGFLMEADRWSIREAVGGYLSGAPALFREAVEDFLLAPDSEVRSWGDGGPAGYLAYLRGECGGDTGLPN